MIGYFLVTSLRNFWRNKLHSLINLASLTIGLAVFGFALIYAKFEFSYDTRWPDADRIHRLVVEQRGLPGRTDGISDYLMAEGYDPLLQYLGSDIEHVTRLYTTGLGLADAEQRSYFNVTAADPSFTRIFRPEIVSGSLEAALQAPGFIAVNETIAARFPVPLTLGDRIRLESGNLENAAIREFEVAAIYRNPAPVSVAANFAMITLMDDYSLPLFAGGGDGWNSYVKMWFALRPGVDLEVLQRGLPDHVERSVTLYNQNLQAGEKISDHLLYRFQSLTSVRFEPIGGEVSSRQADRAQVITIAAVGVLVLLVGCSNSISLSLAAVLERRRTIGIHKAVGALQGNIFTQFLGESVLLALLSLAPAWALVQWLFPVFKAMLRLPAGVEAVAADLVPLTTIAVLVGFASGVYPALMLARVKPQLVLKAGTQGNARSAQGLRMLLVGFQFCFAVMLMIGTLALFLQLRLLREQPLGFNPHNLVFLITSSYTRGTESSTAAVNELMKIPGVSAVTWMGNPPNSNLPPTMNATKFFNPISETGEVLMQTALVGAEALDILQIPLLAGRGLDVARDSRDPKTRLLVSQQEGEAPAQNPLVLNRTAVRALGFPSPEAAMGQFIQSVIVDREGQRRESSYQIIGVAEDSMMTSLRRRPQPEGYMLSAGSNILLQYEDSVAPSIQQSLLEAMQRITGTSEPALIRFIEQSLAAEFAAEDSQGRLLLYCAGLALLLSCIGLYGLASFTMQRNVKEVGVRKVMGASSARLVAIYLWRYAKPVLAATVLASPVALYFVLQWMRRFPYQLEVGWLLPLCLAASAVVLVIAMLTIAGIVAKAARARPVESLRYE